MAMRTKEEEIREETQQVTVRMPVDVYEKLPRRSLGRLSSR